MVVCIILHVVVLHIKRMQGVELATWMGFDDTKAQKEACGRSMCVAAHIQQTQWMRASHTVSHVQDLAQQAACARCQLHTDTGAVSEMHGAVSFNYYTRLLGAYTAVMDTRATTWGTRFQAC